jgi:nitrogen fixation protein NifU and related proteins
MFWIARSKEIILMSNLLELYQETMMDHAKHPRNFGALEQATSTAEGNNPLCGDRVKVYMRVENQMITGISFEGMGCAVTKASASMMTEVLLGQQVEEAIKTIEIIQSMIVNGGDAPIGCSILNALSGVSKYPMRVKCATLPWHALKQALEEELNR